MVKIKKQLNKKASAAEMRMYLRHVPLLFFFFSILLCYQAINLLYILPSVLAEQPSVTELLWLISQNLLIIFFPFFAVPYVFSVIRLADRHELKIDFSINAISVFLSYVVYIFLFAASYLVIDYIQPSSFKGTLTPVDSLSISIGVSTTVGPPSIDIDSDAAKYLLMIQEICTFIYVVVFVGLLVSLMSTDRYSYKKVSLKKDKIRK